MEQTINNCSLWIILKIVYFNFFSFFWGKEPIDFGFSFKPVLISLEIFKFYKWPSS